MRCSVEKIIILHTAAITRNKDGFEELKNIKFRQKFYTTLNKLMRDLEYSVVACVIHKDKHYETYGLSALNPYLLSLNILVERFCMDVRSAGENGIIVGS